MRAGEESSVRATGRPEEGSALSAESFIVRLWREPATPPRPPEWRGTVLRVGARRGRSFRTLAGLARRMDELLRADEDGPAGSNPA